jgi:membrane protein DedA with SNARE-associated domain
VAIADGRARSRRVRHTIEPVGSHEIQHLVREYGCLLVFVVVGLQALGLPLPGTTALIVMAGASGMTLKRFLPISAAAALVWALVGALEYYWFGRALVGASTWVQVGIVCAGIAWVLLSLTCSAGGRCGSWPAPRRRRI